jgi:hypothetical protein
MTSPFDAAAGAVGFASLGVLLLQGCVKGFVLLCTAQNFGQDADVVRCEIEFEQYRLYRWSEKAGLGDDSPNRNLNWELINDILKQLDSRLSDTSKFKKEYGLELITTEEKLSVEDVEPPKTGLRGSIARIKPKFYNETARSLQKGNHIWKRLKWAAIDKVGIEMLMSDIRRFIDNLYELLLYDDRKFIKAGIEALLRHAVSQATDPSELSDIEKLLGPKHSMRSKFEDSAVKAALGLKQKRLMLGFGEESPQSSATSSSTTLVPSSSSATSTPRKPMALRGSAPRGPLPYKSLTRTDSAHDRREIATFDGKPVLVEWKSVERGVESKLKHRIKTLAALLQEVDSATFHSLSCLGYLKDPTTGNYGYIFQTPAGHSQTPTFNTLAQLLTRGTLVPSLNSRIALAILLVETVLQLHTSGWLHKGIRSDNVLFFPHDPESIDLTKAVLEGYEYARADNPSDMTESPTLQQEENLYRHPELLKPDRASFHKGYDLYALGCTLIEIGLWTSITTILLHFVRKERTALKSARISFNLTYEGKAEMTEVNKAKNRLLMDGGTGSIQEALEFATGRSFVEIVRLCLFAGKDTKAVDGDEEEDEEDRCIDLELEILEKLRACSV